MTLISSAKEFIFSGLKWTWNKILRFILVLYRLLTIAIYLALLALIPAPLILAVLYPDSGEHISSISKILIPTAAFVFLILMFNKTLGRFSENILNRVKTLKGKNLSVEFIQSGASLLTLSETDAEILKDKIQTQKNAAQLYYFKYLRATLLGSQVELLSDLHRKGEMTIEEINPYYLQTLKRIPNSEGYSFEQYVYYLTSNFLLQSIELNKKYIITDAAQVLLRELPKAGLSAQSFTG